MRKLFVVMGIIFALLIVTSAHTQAQEIYGCVNKRSGKLRIVSDCTKCTQQENCISWNIEGPQGESGQPGEQGPVGPAGEGCVKVYDSSNPPQYLGILLSLEPEQPGGEYHIAEIFIPSLNIATIITEDNTPAGTGNIIQANVLFGDIGCSDYPYLRRDMYRCDILYRCGIRYFYSISPMIDSNVSTASYLAYASTGGCANISGVYQHVSQAIELNGVEIPFTLPVELPLRYECQGE